MVLGTFTGSPRSGHAGADAGKGGVEERGRRRRAVSSAGVGQTPRMSTTMTDRAMVPATSVGIDGSSAGSDAGDCMYEAMMTGR